MQLNSENYFSIEMDQKYMSVSQYKNFEKCNAKAVNDLIQESEEDKQCFLEGHLFENIVAGDEELFYAKHPEIISSRGPTKGELKSNFKTVVTAANKIKEQEFIMDIINKCEKQVILVGKINGIDVKCCLDLFDMQNKKIYDLKCMKSFKDEWNDKEKCYMPWYYNYGYVLQMAVYQEIVRQNYGFICDTHLIAASKETVPDMQALRFDNKLLELELKEFSENIQYYDNIKKGLAVPISCGTCDYCKTHKKIISFREVI